MTITVNGVEIADPQLKPASDFRVNGDRVLQIAAFLRAAAVSVFDRGNRQTSVSFAVDRTFESSVAAMAWMLDVNDDTPAVTTVVMTHTDGTDTITATITGCGIRRVSTEWRGLAALIRYELVCGSITVVTTAAPEDIIDGGAFSDTYGPAMSFSVDGGHWSDRYPQAAMAIDGGSF